MAKRTVLKVDISCNISKKKMFKAVCALRGVDSVEVDAAKGTLTVTGDADPIEVIARARKAGRYAEVVSICPDPPPPPKAEPDGQKKKGDEEKQQKQKQKPTPQEKKAQDSTSSSLQVVHLMPPCPMCPMCHQYTFQEPYLSCTIM